MSAREKDARRGSALLIVLGMFAFIVIFGMRLMWMSMRALRPVQ